LESIAKKIWSVVACIIFIAVAFFSLVWYCDGFSVAWQFFFRSNTVPAFLELVGFGDWLIGMFISFIVAGIIEVLLGRHLKSKGVRIVVDGVAFLISLVGYLQIIT